MEHTPKKHSPLASPSVRDDSAEEMDFCSSAEVEEEPIPSVEEEIHVVERTQMDPAPPLLSTDSSPTFDTSSPYGSPSTQQLESYLALHSELALALSPRRSQEPIPLPPPSPTSGWDSDEEGDDLPTIDGFLAQVDQDYAGVPGVDGAFAAGVVGDLDRPLPGEVIDLASFKALRERSLSPPPHLAQPVDFFVDDKPELGSFEFMEVDGGSALGLETSGGGPMLPAQGEDPSSAEMAREMDTSSGVAEEALSALERIFICAKSEKPEERYARPLQ